MPPRIVIVGAGLSGLSLAFRLGQRLADADIQVLESGDRPGGTALTIRKDGFTVELGPNGFLDSKPSTIQLARDLGLESRLVAGSETAGKNRYLFLGDKLQRLPGSLGEFLTTPLLSWRGKLSFLAERFRRGAAQQPGCSAAAGLLEPAGASSPAAADESIDAFARRRAGREVAEVFADALVTGIYAGDPELLSLSACFPRIAAMEREFGSVLKGFAAAAKKRKEEARASGGPAPKPGRIWSFDGGLGVLVGALTQALRLPPIFGVRVRSLELAGDPHRPTWTIRGEGKDVWLADAVVLACPAHEQARILSDVNAPAANLIAGIPTNSVAVVALGYRAGDVPGGVDGFGFIAPERLRRDLLGVQWCSSIFPARAPQGTILMRAMCGGWHRAEMVSWDDARLVTAVRAELNLIQSITAEPVFCHIQRWQPGIPQYHVGHLARLQAIDKLLEPHRGLYLSGNSYRGVAMNDCTEQATILAERIASIRLSAQT